MLARFTTAADPAQILRSAWLLIDPPLLDISRDGGRTWRSGCDMAEFVQEHPAALTAPRQTVKRLPGNRAVWVLTLNDRPTPPPAPEPPRPAPAAERQTAMDIDKLYPSRYLSPDDLKGKSVRVTVSEVTIEELRNPRAGGTTKKAVIHFAKSQKVLPLNKTQAHAMMATTGSSDTDAWPGFVVILTAGRAPNGQQTIVITAPAPTPEQKQEDDDSKDDFENLPRAMDDPEHVAKIK